LKGLELILQDILIKTWIRKMTKVFICSVCGGNHTILDEDSKTMVRCDNCMGLGWRIEGFEYDKLPKSSVFAMEVENYTSTEKDACFVEK